MSAPHRSLQTPAAPGARAWFGLLGAPLAWMAQLLLGWWLAQGHCANPLAAAVLHPPAGSRAAQLLIGAAAFAVALLSFFAGLRGWRAARQPHPHRLQADGRPEFLAVCALLVSAVFMLAIAWAWLATAMLPVCEAVR